MTNINSKSIAKLPWDKVPKSSKVFFFYYRKILRELNKQNWKPKNCIIVPYDIKFSTITIDYNHDVYEMIKRSFKRIGWDFQLKRYTASPQEKKYEYEFQVKKSPSAQ